MKWSTAFRAIVYHKPWPSRNFFLALTSRSKRFQNVTWSKVSLSIAWLKRRQSRVWDPRSLIALPIPDFYTICAESFCSIFPDPKSWSVESLIVYAKAPIGRIYNYLSVISYPGNSKGFKRVWTKSKMLAFFWVLYWEFRSKTNQCQTTDGIGFFFTMQFCFHFHPRGLSQCPEWLQLHLSRFLAL